MNQASSWRRAGNIPFLWKSPQEPIYTMCSLFGCHRVPIEICVPFPDLKGPWLGLAFWWQVDRELRERQAWNIPWFKPLPQWFKQSSSQASPEPALHDELLIVITQQNSFPGTGLFPYDFLCHGLSLIYCLCLWFEIKYLQLHFLQSIDFSPPKLPTAGLWTAGPWREGEVSLMLPPLCSCVSWADQSQHSHFQIAPKELTHIQLPEGSVHYLIHTELTFKTHS